MTIFGYFEIFPIFRGHKGQWDPGPYKKKVAQGFWDGKKQVLAQADLYFHKMKKKIHLYIL